MALSVSDGSLVFNATLNTDDFATAQRRIEASLQDIATKAVETSKRSNDAFKNLIPADLNSAEIDAVIEKIQQLQEEEEKLQKAIAGTDDKNALSAYSKALDEVQSKLDAAPAELYKAVLKEVEAQMVKTSQAVAGALDVNTDETVNGVSQIGDKAQRVSARIREITNELVGLERGTPEFNALISEAADLTDALGDARAQINLLASDTSKLDAGIEVVQGLAGVFAAAQGAMALFGDENEDLQKTLVKVNAAMAILQGAQQVGALLDKNSALNVALLKGLRLGEAAATGAQVAATEGLIVAEEGAIVTQQGLNAAMAANPAGVLLLAITAIVGAYQLLSSQIKDVTEEQTKMNEALAKANETLLKIVDNEKISYQERTKAAAEALGIAEAQGKSEADILALQAKVIQARKLENVYVLSRLGYDKQSLALAQDQIRSYNDQIHGLESLKALGQELTKEETKRLELLENQKKSLETTYNPGRAAYDEIIAADAEAATLRAEQARKAHEDALKSAGAEADARLIAAKKNSKEELNARIADIKEQARIELDNVNLTAGERRKILEQERKDIADANRAFNILQLNNQKELINARLDQVKIGSNEELQLRIDLINKNAAIERAQEGLTQERKLAIEASTAKQISELTKKYLFENQEIELNTVIAGINTRLSTAEIGSKQELDLRKELIDEKASLEVVGALKSIENEKLRVAKIKEINARARQEQKKADDDYYDNLLKKDIAQIEQSNSFASIPLNEIVNNTSTSALQKFVAQKQIIANELDAVQSEINLVGNNIIKNRGDLTQLNVQLEALRLRKAQLQSGSNLLDAKATSVYIETIQKYAQLAASSFNRIAESVRPINEELANVLETMGNMADITSNVLSSFSSFSSGDIVGGITSAVGAVSAYIGLVSGAFSNADVVAYQKQLEDFNRGILIGEEKINALYRQRTLEQAKLNKLKIDGLNAEAAALSTNLDQAIADYNRILDLIHKETFRTTVVDPRDGQVLTGTGVLNGRTFEQLQQLNENGQLSEGAKAYFDQLVAIKNEIDEINKAKTENERIKQETFTGTTSDAILDSIVQGFADGKRATEDFADNFEDLMKKAILNSIKYQTLQKPLQDFYDQFAADAQSGGSLDTVEIDKLKNSYNEILENANKKFEELQKVTNVNFSSATSGNNTLSGAIKGITATQADLLAGQFGGLRVSNLEILATNNQQLFTLNRIEANTAETNTYLANYFRKWDTLGIKVII